MIGRVLLMAVLVAWLLPVGVSPAGSAEVETRHLVASDATGRLSEAQLKGQADEAQAMLERVLVFWSGDPEVARWGKIHVIFDEPRRTNYSCVFYFVKAQGGRSRAVRVFGFAGGMQMLAHKLTSALYPQPDKLIRNMMGIVAETRIGNPLTFPRCGLSSDDWVLALLQDGSYIPLKDLGPDHESWGMSDAGGGRLTVFDRAKQHRAYAEAGSFGNYLHDLYGVEKLRQLHQLSGERARAAQDVYGKSLEELEADWLAALKKGGAANEANVALASRLFHSDPRAACMAAQRNLNRER